MAPEISLILLVPLYGGPWLLACGLLRFGRADPLAGERAAWRTLWWPLLVPGIVIGLLVGFGLEELSDFFTPGPDGPEAGLFPFAICLSLPFSLIWARALVRAVASLLGPVPHLAAATVGVWRPQVSLAPEFEAGLSPDERAAVEAHEQAHVRHRDPLRIWLAQLATDLQWPAPEAQRRFTRWREELEVARDDDARRAGADDAALAGALVAAARFAQPGKIPIPVAAMALSTSVLRRRVERLLGAPPAPVSKRWSRPYLGYGAAAAVVALGATAGDILFRLLPGVGG